VHRGVAVSHVATYRVHRGVAACQMTHTHTHTHTHIHIYIYVCVLSPYNTINPTLCSEIKNFKFLTVTLFNSFITKLLYAIFKHKLWYESVFYTT
jgi:hypothetical protein